MIPMEEQQEKIGPSFLSAKDNYDAIGHKTGHINREFFGDWNYYDD